MAPYHPDYAVMKDIPIVQAGTAYDDRNTGETMILVINLGLYFGDSLPNSLINPNQMRLNGVEVDDVPKHLSPKSTHSIYIPEHNIRIPLSMRGVISYIPIRKPTEWDPHSDDFEANERIAHENETSMIPSASRTIHSINSSSFNGDVLNMSGELSASLVSKEELLARAINSIGIQDIRSSQHRGRVWKEELSRMWKIGLDSSAITLMATTQLAIKNAIHPIQRRFWKI